MDRFEPIRPLGRGGMGEVVLARDRVSGAEVALKRLPPEVADPESRLRFAREAEALTRVTHPAVVRLVGWGQEGGRPWLAMEHLPGGSLEERVQREGPLPEAEVAELGAALARGLVAAHEAGVVHRDVKPGNVLFDAAGRPRLVDFGLTRPLARGASLTATGALLGTPGYMAPEQASGDPRAVGPAADVWGLGATLYFLLAGRPPHAGGSPLEVLAALVSRDPPPPSDRRPGLDPRLERIVLRALARAPAQRYPSASALALALEGWATPPADLHPRRLGSRPSGAIGLLLAGSLLALLVGRRLVPPEPAPQPPPARPDPAQEDPAAPSLAAERALQRGEWAEAAEQARRAGELEPGDAWPAVMEGCARLFLGQGQAARLAGARALERELDGRPDPERLLSRARLAMALGRWDAAQADLDRAAALPGGETASGTATIAVLRNSLAARRAGVPGPTHQLLAQLLELPDAQAEPILSQAWATDGAAWEARVELAIRARLRGDPGRAREHLAVALAIRPDDPTLLRACRELHEQTGVAPLEGGELGAVVAGLDRRVPGAEDRLERFLDAHPHHVPALLLRAAWRQGQGDAPEVLRALLARVDQELARDPSQAAPGLWKERGELHLVHGEPCRARAAFELAAGLCPREPYIRLRRAQARVACGAFSDAAEDLAWLEVRVAERAGLPALVEQLRALLEPRLEAQRRAEEAQRRADAQTLRAALRELLALDPEEPWGQLAEAELRLEQEGPGPGLARRVDELLTRHPAHGAAWRLRAELDLLLGDPQAAIDDAGRALQLDPADGYAPVVRGLARLLRFEPGPARRDLELALARPLDPRLGEARRINRARLAGSFGRWSEALADLEAAGPGGPRAALKADMREALLARREGRPGPTHRALAEADQARLGGRRDRAREILDLAVRRDPRAWEAYQGLAGLATEDGDEATAQQHLSAALCLRPEAPELIRQAGRAPDWEPDAFAKIVLALGEAPERLPADDDLAAFVRENPGHLEARLLRGYRLRAQAMRGGGGPDRAQVQAELAAIDEALQRDPSRTTGEVLFQRAELRYLLQDLPGALQDLDRALEFDVRAPFVRLQRGRLRRLLGDRAGAQADLDWLDERTGPGREGERSAAVELRRELEADR